MSERDHRDDGNAISGVFYAIPISLALWGIIVLIIVEIVRHT